MATNMAHCKRHTHAADMCQQSQSSTQTPSLTSRNSVLPPMESKRVTRYPSSRMAALRRNFLLQCSWRETAIFCSTYRGHDTVADLTRLLLSFRPPPVRRPDPKPERTESATRNSSVPLRTTGYGQMILFCQPAKQRAQTQSNATSF